MFNPMQRLDKGIVLSHRLQCVVGATTTVITSYFNRTPIMVRLTTPHGISILQANYSSYLETLILHAMRQVSDKINEISID